AGQNLAGRRVELLRSSVGTCTQEHFQYVASGSNGYSGRRRRLYSNWDRSDVVTPGVFTSTIWAAIGSYAGRGETTPLATTTLKFSGRTPTEYICWMLVLPTSRLVSTSV